MQTKQKIPISPASAIKRLFNNRKKTMNSESKSLVIIVKNGIDNELSSVALTIANGALTEGMNVHIFLTSSAVDLVRRSGIEMTQVSPLDPLKNLLNDVLSRGGHITACSPCVRARGYTQSDLLDGVVVQGASAILIPLKNGASSLSF